MFLYKYRMTEIGQQETLPSYDNIVHRSTFNLYPQPTLNKFNSWILAILFNTPYIYIVADLEKQGRSYYNQAPKQFCSTIRLGAVEGFQGQAITVYLPTLRKYHQQNNLNTTTLMKLIAVQKLPTCWSNIVLGGTGECKNESINNNNTIKLTSREKVLYYYIKYSPFFVNLLSALKNSFDQFVERKYYCQNFTFPAELYPGTKEERTIFATGDYLKAIYSYYLERARNGSHLKLPQPTSMK
jgi:hypothetical protein